MTGVLRWWILGVAVAVNGAALAAAHMAMVQTRVHEELALQQPARIVVSAPPKVNPVAAAQQCPAPKVL